jgi:hypothetical protein
MEVALLGICLDLSSGVTSEATKRLLPIIHDLTYCSFMPPTCFRHVDQTDVTDTKISAALPLEKKSAPQPNILQKAATFAFRAIRSAIHLSKVAKVAEVLVHTCARGAKLPGLAKCV